MYTDITVLTQNNSKLANTSKSGVLTLDYTQIDVYIYLGILYIEIYNKYMVTEQLWLLVIMWPTDIDNIKSKMKYLAEKRMVTYLLNDSPG